MTADTHTIAALGLHLAAGWSGLDDRKGVHRARTMLERIAAGGHVPCWKASALLAELNAYDAERKAEKDRAGRLKFVGFHRVRSWEFWLPGSPDDLTATQKRKILDAGGFYRHVRGHRHHRICSVPNSKAGREVFDEIMRTGKLTLVIPRTNSVDCKAACPHFGTRKRGSVLSTARQLERMVYRQKQGEKVKRLNTGQPSRRVAR